MENLPPLTATQLQARVVATYSLLEEQYRRRPEETVQGAAAVLYVELLRLVQRLAQHDPPLRLAFERLLDDSVPPEARPDDFLFVKPGTFRVVDLLHLAAARGVVCYGPDRDNQPTFVRADAWIPHWQDVPREQAEGALLRRLAQQDEHIIVQIHRGSCRSCW